MSRLHELLAQIQETPGDDSIVREFLGNATELGDYPALETGLSGLIEGDGAVAIPMLVSGLADALTASAAEVSDRDASERLLRAARLRLLVPDSDEIALAVEALADAWSRCPDPRILDVVGEVLGGPGDAVCPDELLVAYTQVGPPERTLGALHTLADRCLDRGDAESGERYVRALLALDPGDADAKKMLAELQDTPAPSTRQFGTQDPDFGGAGVAPLPTTGPAHIGTQPVLEAAPEPSIDTVASTESAPDANDIPATGEPADLAARIERALPYVSHDRSVLLRRRLAAIHRDELGDAAAAYEALVLDVMEDPNPPTALVDARGLAAAGTWQEALDLLESAMAQAPPEAQSAILLEIARIAEAGLGDRAAAENAYRRLRMLNPQAIAALAFFSEWYIEEHDARRAYAVCAQLHGQLEGGDTTEDRLRLATSMADLAEGELQSPEKAIEAWRRVIEDAPGHVQANESLRSSYGASDRWGALADHLERWVRAMPDSEREHRVELLFELTELYQDGARLPSEEKLLEAYRRIAEDAPGNEAALDHLAHSYEDQARWRDLEGVLKQKLEVASDPVELLEIHHRIATLYFDRIRSDDEALPVLEQLLSMDPDNPEVLRHLREIHMRRFDQQRVYDTYQEELRFLKGRDRLDVLVELATIAGRDLKNHEEALDWWSQVLELDPSQGDALRALQEQHTRLRDWPAYVGLLENRLGAASTRKQKVELLQELGEVTYDHLEDTARALEIFGRIAELSPFNARARSFLRRVHVEQRDWQALRAQYATRSDWTGYLVLLREAAQRTEDRALAADIQMEIARGAAEFQGDEASARDALMAALDLDESCVDAARLLVGLHGEQLAPDVRGRAVTCLARHGNDDDERPSAWREIAAQLSEGGDMARAHEAWLEVAALEAPHGSIEVLEEILDAASASDAWAGTAEALSEVLALLPRDALDARLDVHRQLGVIFRSRLGDTEGATLHHSAVLAEAPGDEIALAALEEIHLSQNDFEGLESVLRMRANQGLTPETRREACQRLGQLYEDVLMDLGRAAETFQAMLESDSDDSWALSSLRRVRMMDDAHEAFVADLDELLPRLSDPGLRSELTLEQARVLRTCLGEHTRAAAILHGVLSDGGEGQAEALATLEAMFAAGEALETVSELLDGNYRSRGDLPRLAHVLEVRLGTAEDTDERLQLVDELLALYGGELPDPARAFDTLCMRFELAPEDRGTWDDLEKLAGETQLWEALASRWQLVLDGQGHGPGYENVSDATQLRVRLASLVHHRLGRPDEAVEVYERVLADADDLAGQYDVLEALEAIYVERDAPEDVVRIRMLTSESHMDGAVRRSKLLDACSVLAERLERPEEALAHYERLVTENPADDEFADRYENTLQDLERWETLIDHLERRAEALGTDDATDRLDFRRAMVQLRRLGDLTAALESLLVLVPSQAIGSQVHDVLRELAVDPMTTDETRSRIVAKLTEHFHVHEDRLGRAALLEVKSQFATPGMNRAHLLLEAAGLVVAEAGEIEEDGLHLRLRAFGLYADALREVPTSAVTLSALDDLVENLDRWEIYADLMAEVSDACSEPSVATGMRRRAAHAIEVHLEDVERAIICWESVINTDRKHSGSHRKEALAALDRLYGQTDRRSERVKVLQQRVELTDRVMERVEMLRDAARLLHDLGRNDEAISTLQGLVREARATRRKDLIAARTQALEHLDLLLTETKRHEELVGLLVENAEESRDPDQARLELYRAAEIAEGRMHRPALAVEIFEKVRALDRFDEIALERLDKLYTTCGQWEEKIAVLEDRIELARRAEDEPALRDLWFTLGQLRENRLHDSVSAVEAYAACLATDPEFAPAIAALQLGASEAAAGCRSREVLSFAYRNTQAWAELASCLESRITHGDAASAPGGFEAELASLYLDKLDSVAEAWPHAAAAYRAQPGDAEGSRRRELLARSAEAESLAEDLADLLLDVGRTIPSDTARLTRHRDDIELLAGRGAGDLALAPIWKEILTLDPSSADALSALERVARSTKDTRKLVDVLRRRADHAGDEAQARSLRVEVAQILANASGEEDEAIGLFHALLVDAPEDLQVFEQLATLYRRMERWDDLSELLRSQLKRTPEADEAAHWHRELALLSWQVFEDGARAVSHARSTLATLEDDSAVVSLLETLGGTGSEPQAVLELLEPVYKRAGDDSRLADLYRKTLERDSRPPVKRSVLPRLIALEMGPLEDPERAYESAKALVKVSQDRDEHLDRLEALASDTERWPDLVDFLESLLGHEPADVPLIRRTGALAMTQLDDMDRAMVHERAILAIDPSDAQARDAITIILTDAERWEDLVEHLRTIAEGPEDGATRRDALLMAAEVLDEHLERMGDAASLLQSAVALDPKDDDISERLASTLETLGDRDRLHVHYRSWIKESPGDISFALHLRLATSLLQRPDSAASGVDEIRALLEGSEPEVGARELLDGFLADPDHRGDSWRRSVEAGIALIESLSGESQTAAERAELAEIRLRTLDRADDEAREARRTAAQQREAAGDIEGALAHYSHLLADAPEDEELAEELAAVADRHDRWEDLASILSQSVTDGVAHGTRVDRMARIARVHLDKLKDPASAVSWYERLLESEPTHVEAFECLTKHYREGGQAQDEARVLDQWRRSVGDDPSGALRRRLAALHMDELGQPETALALLEEDLGAVVADEDLFARGERLYAHFERYEDLAELYRLALELDDASASDRVDLLARLTQLAETQLEDDDLTRESALSVIALEPTHAYAMGSLERVARKTGQWQDLDRAFDLQLEVTHDDDARAALLLSRGETAIRRLGDPLGALACALEANDLIGSEDAADRLVPLLEALLEAQESRLDAARTLEPLFAHAKRWTDQISVVRIRLDAATEPGAAEDLARHLAGLAEDRLEDPMTALGVLLDTLGRFPSRIGMRSAIDRLAADTAGYRRVAKTLEEITPRLEDDTRLAGELWLGTIRHENLGDDSGATKALESVVRQEPAHRRALALLAKIYERMQKWDALVTTYERLARVTGPDSERARVHMQHAEVLESRLEALDRARGVCEEALTADGTNVDALAMLERIARHRQDFGGLDQALGRRIEATSADRDKVALLLQRADNLLANLDGSTEALALLEQAQDHAGTKRDRARIASLYEVLLDRETTRPVAARHLAEHYETTRRWSELVSALEILQAHASDDGERREIGLRLATVCEHRIGDAPAALGTLLGLLEGTETPMTVAPEIDRLAKDTDAWGVVADRLDDLVGESSQAQRVELARWLGRIHLDRLDDVDQAISAYERVLALDDGHRETLELLEALYEETGDGAALMRILSARVASTDGLGERVGLLMKKARVAEDELGDLEAARQACEAILALEPGHLDALEALERFAGTRRDWKDMDRVLTSRFEASSDASERLHLMLSRARNLLQHLDGAAEALDLTIAADDAARSGDETGEVVATLELLLAVEPTAERAATRLVPHYEGARRWSDLVATVEILGSHATSSDEREALALRASKLAETQLGDGGRGLDILLGALEREPANLNLRQEISRMAERVDAWGRVSEVVGPLLTHGLNPTLTVELGLWLARIRREHLDSPEGAADALERVLAVDAVHGEALNGLDEIYRATGRDDRLRTLLDARLAVVSDAERPTILEELADVTYRCEGPAASLNVWRQLIWERPDHEEARERIAGMLGSPDTMNDAASILEPIFRREADWPMLAHVLECKLEASTDSREGLSIRSQVAEIYERRIEDPNRAFEHLVEVFAEQPSRIELRDRLCSLAESAGLWDRLAQALERAVSTVTEERLRVGHLLALAPILEDRREDAEGAITALERVLVIESREPTALAGLRRLYGVTGHDAGSLDATFRLAEITTDGAKAEALYREALGLAILLEETSIEARACEAILVQAPEDDAVAARLAERYEESEQYEALADLLSDRVEGSDDPKEVARRHQRLAQLRYDKLLDVEGALPHYAEAWDRDEGRLDAFEALEAAYRERRNWSELYGLLSERATRLGSDPAAAGVWLELASISERQLDDVPEAISAYESALKVDGKSEVALDSLIRLYHRHERHRELARCYQAKAEITAARAEKLDLLALAANLLAGRLEEDDAARSLIDEVLAAEVQHALGNMVRARLLARAGEPEEAAKVLETARIHLEGGEEVEALVLLGRLYREELNRPEDALERLTLAQKLAPQHPDLAVALRELYEKTGAWSELSQCMENEYDAAEDAIERCARALGLARLYLDHLGNEKAFLLWIDRAREARSDSVEAAEALIDFHTSKEEWTQVAPHLEWLVNYLEGKRLVRDLPLRAHELARIFERLGQGEDALQYYKMAMNADGAYLENLIEYGRLLVEMGRWDRALRVYQSLLMQQQSLPNASTLSDMLHNLAWTCHELGMTGQAQQHVKRLLELDPDHAPGLALRTRLV